MFCLREEAIPHFVRGGFVRLNDSQPAEGSLVMRFQQRVCVHRSASPKRRHQTRQYLIDLLEPRFLLSSVAAGLTKLSATNSSAAASSALPAPVLATEANSPAISSGQRVECTENGVNVRSSPNASITTNIIGAENAGDEGTFESGPYLGGNYTWDYVQWDNLSQPGYTVTNYIAVLTTPPAASTEAATSITSNSAELNGDFNPNGISTSAYFEYGTTTSYGQDTVQSTPYTGTSTVYAGATLTGLAQDTTYHYQLVAVNSNAQIADGGDVSFYTPLPAPTLSSPTASSSPTFSWSQVSGNYGYRIIVDSNANDLPTSANSSSDATASINVTTTQNDNLYPWTGTPLLPDTTYYWQVHALGAAGGGA